MTERRITDPDVEVDLLAEYEQLFQTVFERSDEGILIVEPDANGGIIEANQAAADMHGYTVEEMLELRASDLHLEDDYEDVQKSIERMTEGEWVANVHEHRRKDGSTFPIRFRAGAIYYQGRRVLLSFVRDVSEQKLVEHDLAMCQSELASLMY